MKIHSLDKWCRVFPLYLLAGLLPGMADAWLGDCVRLLGIKPGLVTAASVNLLLPLVAVGLGAAYPRAASAWLGAIGMTGGYVLGLSVAHPVPGGWDGIALLRSIPPVLVAACLGYALLGTLAGLAAQRMTPAD